MRADPLPDIKRLLTRPLAFVCSKTTAPRQSLTIAIATINLAVDTSIDAPETRSLPLKRQANIAAVNGRAGLLDRSRGTSQILSIASLSAPFHALCHSGKSIIQHQRTERLPMAFISLDRNFIEWNENTRPEWEPLRMAGFASGVLKWTDILAKKRVVILAEGGSGKSTEFNERHRAMVAEGKFSFELTVKKAGERGIAASLTTKQARRLEEWRESDQPAWFFVDSVDEAKAAGVLLSDALAHVAEAIEGAEDRAHVIFSGRPSEWEYRKDFDALMDVLSPPSMLAEPDAIDVDEVVVNAIRRKRHPPTPSPSKALVCTMAPLDDRQIETFAHANKIQDVALFLHGLKRSNLWPFARRPLDLDWLAHYWLSHGKFASFEKMLEANLIERLTEANPARARDVRLDQDQAMRALERVGAALVLSKTRDLEIFDGTGGVTPHDALRLRDALPDMPQALQADLINAAIFVPASGGLVRLQNDTDGIVRSYLAARWLRRMLSSNCPWSAARDMLFAETYGVSTVKPSMVAVAAWLSIWEPRAADELIRRQPMALVEHGDASSLPELTRRNALRSIVADLNSETAVPLLNHEGLMRFAGKDMEGDIIAMWESLANSGAGSDAPKQLLLQMITEGRLAGCGSIAFDAATASGADTLTRTLAVQAVAEVGDEALRTSYGAFLRTNASALDASFLWSAVDLLFPDAVTANDVVSMLPKLLDGELSAGYGVDFYGPKLVKKISVLNDAKLLLATLMARLPQTAKETADADVDVFAPMTSTIACLASRILDLDVSPTPLSLAIDASLRLTALNSGHGLREDAQDELRSRLRSTPERRQATLWRLSETYATLEVTSGEPLNDLWQLHMARFDSGVGLQDIDWLLSDAKLRQDINEQLLALRLAMLVWSRNGKPSELLHDATMAVSGSATLLEAIEPWKNPSPTSEHQLRLDESHAKYEAENREREARRKASWVAFVNRIRNAPEELSSLVPPSPKGIDARIYHIWELLEGLSDNSHGKSMSDVNLLKPIFGPRALTHIKSAFIRYWRLGAPTLRSERPPAEVNIVGTMDRVGLVGVSFEAVSDPTWPSALTDEEAALATVYATLELNRFPKWFERLALAKQDPVRDVLRRAAAPELSATFVGERREALERIADSPPGVADLMADDMLLVLSSPASHPASLLRLALRIVRRSGRDQAALLQLALSKAKEPSTPDFIAVYLSCAFAIDGLAATAALVDIAPTLKSQALTELASALLPSLTGTTWHRGEESQADKLQTEELLKLTRFAFDAIRPSDDNDRANGKVYSPDARDDAESARDMLFKRLASRPGAATFAALQHLAADGNFPTPTSWLARLARERAEQDSESAPWTAPDVKAFEDDYDTVPRNPEDLQRVAMARIEDLQHRLIHSDYGLGSVAKSLPQEVDVQRWMAGELEARAGRSYTLEREPHVADEKEPDIRLSSRGSDARLPIEIKVAESWSLSQLETALTTQLAGRYLRNRNGRWGILLLVHQNERSQGWESTPGKFLSFEETVAHLRKLAYTISAGDSAGPQMQVCVIDVSSVNSQPRGPVKSKPKRQGKSSS